MTTEWHFGTSPWLLGLGLLGLQGFFGFRSLVNRNRDIPLTSLTETSEPAAPTQGCREKGLFVDHYIVAQERERSNKTYAVPVFNHISNNLIWCHSQASGRPQLQHRSLSTRPDDPKSTPSTKRKAASRVVCKRTKRQAANRHT